jgi:histidinol phosphatase-like PHP family hydrolase
VLVAISTDAHQLTHLAHIELGVATARRAWIGPAQVVNTWPVEKLLEWTRGARSVRARKAPTARRSR